MADYIISETDEILTPSYHGEKCRHNGSNPNYELACDECDFYLTCMPDWAYWSGHDLCSKPSAPFFTDFSRK